jgi:hypothetical protein
MEATGTAGNLLGLALNGSAEPAVMVTTGWRPPVESIAPEFLWAVAGPFELRSWERAGSPFVSSGSFLAEGEE